MKDNNSSMLATWSAIIGIVAFVMTLTWFDWKLAILFVVWGWSFQLRAAADEKVGDGAA